MHTSLAHGPPVFTLVGSAVYLPQPNFELESVASFEYALRSTPHSSIISKFAACPETDVWQTGFLGGFSTPSALEESEAGGFDDRRAETASSTTPALSHADLAVPCLSCRNNVGVPGFLLRQRVAHIILVIGIIGIMLGRIAADFLAYLLGNYGVWITC